MGSRISVLNLANLDKECVEISINPKPGIQDSRIFVLFLVLVYKGLMYIDQHQSKTRNPGFQDFSIISSYSL